MFRSLLALVACAPLAAAAPVPKKEEPKLYFPVAKGAKAVLVSKDGDATNETVETVTDVGHKDGVYTVSLESKHAGGRTSTRTLEVSERGVFQTAVNGAAGKEPTPLLKAGSKPGDTWAAEVRAPGGQGTRTFTAGKEEELEVPAGKFKAVRVDSETATARGVVSKGSQWYAPGVGMVKSVVIAGKRETVYELKSFTPGPDEKKKDEAKPGK